MRQEKKARVNGTRTVERQTISADVELAERNIEAVRPVPHSTTETVSGAQRRGTRYRRLAQTRAAHGHPL